MELYQLVQKEYQGRTDHSNKLLYREDEKKVVYKYGFLVYTFSLFQMGESFQWNLHFRKCIFLKQKKRTLLKESKCEF